jgi:hypothetical protein
MCGEGFLFGGENCFGGYPNCGEFYSIFGCLLDGYYGVYYFMSPPPSPLNFPQRYDFKGVTPNNYMDKDLSPIFGLNSRFGAVLGRIPLRFRTAFCSRLLNSLVYQRVLGRCFSNFLEDGAPALPVRCHCRIGRVARQCGWSQFNVMKNSVVDKEFAACGSRVG